MLGCHLLDLGGSHLKRNFSRAHVIAKMFVGCLLAANDNLFNLLALTIVQRGLKIMFEHVADVLGSHVSQVQLLVDASWTDQGFVQFLGVIGCH